MTKKYLQDAQKELILAEKKQLKSSALKTVAPAIVIAIFVLIISDDVWKKTVTTNYKVYVPAHVIIWVCGLTTSLYLLSYVTHVRDFVLFFIENRIGFGWRGRMAKSPSTEEVSCMGVLFRGSLIFILYFTALLSALDYL